MRVKCPECGYTISASIGSGFKIPDEYVKQCKHPPEMRKTTKFRDKDADARI
jgi:rRNA maturation protein Nop10